MAATREIGLEVNADKTKYMAMSRDHNAGRSHNIKTHNSYGEWGRTVQIFGNRLKE